MTTFVIIVVLASIVALIVFKRGETLRFETTAQPGQILMQANSEVGTKKRWTVVGQSPNNVIFAYQKGPNKLVALVLILCFLLPGIVYLMLAGKRESLNIMFDVRPDGLSQVQATSNGYRGKLAGRSMRSALASSVPANTAVAAPYAGQPVALAPDQYQPAAASFQTVVAGSVLPASNYQTAQQSAGQHPAAWYPDPQHPGHQRYFDGQQWTEHRAPCAG